MFKDRDVICFYGDSLIAAGLTMAEVFQTIRKKANVKCYNCGISGATTGIGVKYLYSNCLIYNPEYVVLSYGINDIGRTLRSKNTTLSKEEAESRIARLKRYHKENYEILIQAIKAFGAQPILVTPTPYDEYNEHPSENLKVQDDLRDIIKELCALGEKYSCPVLNTFDTLTELIKTRVIHVSDRIHLKDEGYHAVAQAILKELGYIDACDFDSRFEIEEWNKERFEAERKASRMTYVAFCVTNAGGKAEASLDQKKAYVASLLDKLEDKKGDMAQMYEYYLKYADFYEMWRSEALRLTE